MPIQYPKRLGSVRFKKKRKKWILLLSNNALNLSKVLIKTYLFFFITFIKESWTKCTTVSTKPYITEINYILKYIQKGTVLLHCNNISQYYSFYSIDQINAAGEHKRLICIALFIIHIVSKQLYRKCISEKYS